MLFQGNKCMGLLVALSLFLACITCNTAKKTENFANFEESKHRGVCWVGSRNPLQGGEMENLTATGVSHISQTPFGWQRHTSEPSIRWETHSEKIWWGESSKGLVATIDTAQSQGLISILKPHIWVRGSWPGEIAMTTETDWQIWFDNYKSFILYYANLAEQRKLPLFCVGTELEKTSHRENDWREIIAAVKEVYGGKLTYAANFTEYEYVKFWDALDYIGVQAYFPLATGENPTLDQLLQGWKRIIPDLEKVNLLYQKPILFTELGYCNTNDAADAPWVWLNERKNAILSEEMQARCYTAFFESVWHQPWFQGVYFWKWYPESRNRSPDFTPQHKMAQKVMQTYFTFQTLEIEHDVAVKQ
ncbi:glycoside hydrolase family 113 [Cyclobacterium plantarum]|uniref:glycoside hydrolase family 113 n=1 Tax=Cyclobacterium plantarum TaxID=2716263 RepID=UPI003F6FEBCF